MNIVAENFSKMIDALTNSKQIKNASQLSEEIGITKSAIYEIINGRVKKLSGTMVELLRLKYNINPDWLLTGEGKMFLPTKPGELPREIQEINEILMRNPDWARANLNLLKGGESAADLVKALSSLNDSERVMAAKMLKGLQH
jgi:transcriptional regulator with XRE-family HTH domain